MRYWAGARAAAGRDEERLPVSSVASVGALRTSLAARSEEMARVLTVSSLLVDGLAARDDAQVLAAGQVVEVLPPFAGG